MKKAIRTLLCSFLLVAIVFSAAACGDNGSQAQYDDLQKRIEQQDSLLKQQEELLKQQEERLKELESAQELLDKNKELEEQIKELQTTIDKHRWAVSHEVSAVGKSNSYSFLNPFNGTAKLLQSKEDLSSYLMAISEEYRKDTISPGNSEKWSMSYSGKDFDEDTLLEWYDDSFFETKALIFCVFITPNIFIGLTDHHVWRDWNTYPVPFCVELEYYEASMTAINSVMVLLEIDQQEIINGMSKDIQLDVHLAPWVET